MTPAAGGSFADIVVDGGTARARVRPDVARALCAGHFPGDPLLPGTALAGLMAELGAALLAADGHPAVRIRAIQRCVFRTRVRPDGPIDVVVRRAPGLAVAATVDASARRAAHALLAFVEG